MNCIVCGSEFQAVRSDARYCESCKCEIRKKSYKKYYYENREKRISESVEYVRNHGRKPRKITHDLRKCIYCESEFIPKRSDQVSCGKRDSAHRINEAVKKIEISCMVCGRKFQVRHGDQNRSIKAGIPLSCSLACANILRGRSIKVTCSECGKEFYRKRSEADPNNKHFFCSKQCQKKNIDYILRGEDHYQYVNGHTSLTRGKGWTQTRKAVRERDGFTCQQCGRTEDVLGRALDVHHIKPYRMFDSYEDANKIENLVALCASCHHRTEAELASEIRNKIT